jgi:serine/threonine-protein kinase
MFIGRRVAVYRIDEFLGEGGFAYVYKARDTNLDIDVALKVLKPAFAYDEVFEENFRREAHRAAKFRHPNVIAIHYAGKDDDIVFFSMDLLETGLKDLLKQRQPLEEGVIIKVGIDVASALQFAHTHEGGIVHRDLKPDNILFDRHGNAVVTDFGIAEAATNYTAATGTTVYVGTPKYMSPEQARGQRVDHRSDIYSLGVTLYEMAVGEAPFTGRDWFELGRKHIEEPPPLICEKNPDLDPELERVILKCLQKNPTDRYQSAEHLRSELGRLEGVAQRTVILTVQPTQEKKAPTPVPTPAPSVKEAVEEEAREAQRRPADLYEATTQPPPKRSRRWVWLTAAAVLVGFVGAYSYDLGGLRTWGESQFPALARIPYVGTGSVYATSFMYASVEGGAAVDGQFDMTFSGPVDRSTATGTNVQLLGPESRRIPAEVTLSPDGTRITIRPSARLAYAAPYVLRITPQLLSAHGSPILKNARATQPGGEWRFTTGNPPPDTDAPFLAESTPAKDARNVAADQPIRLMFSEEMDPTTLNRESVRLLDAQGNAVDISVYTGDDLQTAQVQPARSLRRGASYTLVLTDSITDRSGNRLAPDTLAFITATPAATPVTPAEPAVLNVRVQPREALGYVRVVLDGDTIGYLPKLNEQIESRRRHNLKLLATFSEYSAYSLQVFEDEFTPRPGQSIDLDPQITPFGFLTVTSEPIADVFIDNEMIGTTPLAGYTLPAGPHQLDLHPRGDDITRHGVLQRQINVPQFEQLTLGSLRLPPAR